VSSQAITVDSEEDIPHPRETIVFCGAIVVAKRALSYGLMN
jgi:hypothetical protein